MAIFLTEFGSNRWAAPDIRAKSWTEAKAKVLLLKLTGRARWLKPHPQTNPASLRVIGVLVERINAVTGEHTLYADTPSEPMHNCVEGPLIPSRGFRLSHLQLDRVFDIAADLHANANQVVKCLIDLGLGVWGRLSEGQRRQVLERTYVRYCDARIKRKLELSSRQVAREKLRA